MVTLNPIKKRKRVKYIEYDINDVNAMIYNDSYNFTFDDSKKIDWNLDKLLLKGEKAALMDTSQHYHYVTSFGRIINGKRVIQLTIQDVQDRYLRIFADQKPWKLENVMEAAGFVYDYDVIKNRYKTQNWKLRWVKG